jgi:hypothetical protein
MKFAFALPFVFLLGLVVGGWAPKEEMRAAKKQADELAAKLAERDKDSRLDAFTRMIKIPERAQAPAKAAPGKQPALSVTFERRAATNGAPPSALEEVAPTSAVREAAAAHDAAKPAKPEDLLARIDEAKALWKTRVDVARAQWIDKLKLTPEETARFDDALNGMNENLYNAMQRLADGLASEETLSPESGLRAFSEMTQSLVTAYDDLAAGLPEQRRGEISKMELTDFIDPGVAEPLVAVQDKLDKIPQNRRPGMRFRR